MSTDTERISHSTISCRSLRVPLKIRAMIHMPVLRRSLFRSNLLNGKQKTTASLGQQPPLFQPMNSTQPNAYDQQLWQQHFPPLQPTTNLPAPLTDTNRSHESKAETSRKADGSSRTQDADPRSLLGKSVTLSCIQRHPSLFSLLVPLEFCKMIHRWNTDCITTKTTLHFSNRSYCLR